MTIQKSEQIKTEIDQITKRLDELTETQKGISGNLKVMQDGFIAGDISLDEMQVEQSKLTVLNDSIKALDAKRSELETDLKAAQSIALRADIVKQLAEAALAAASSFSEHARITDELNGILEQKSGELLDHVASLIENKREFHKLYLQLVPADRASLSIPGADIHLAPEVLGQLHQTGISHAMLRVATTGVLEESDADFSGAITLAKQIAAQKRFALRTAQGALLASQEQKI